MNDPYTDRHTPTEIRVKREEKILEVDFDDGKSFALPAELLRVESPSAEVQGHGPGQKTLITGRRHVGIMGLEQVGNYAVRIKFDECTTLVFFRGPFYMITARAKKSCGTIIWSRLKLKG